MNYTGSTNNVLQNVTQTNESLKQEFQCDKPDVACLEGITHNDINIDNDLHY